MKISLGAGLLAFLSATPSLAQGLGKPIIDMHLHARPANYFGANPPPMCAPFSVMPRSDPKAGIFEGMAFNGPPCAQPISAASSDEAVLGETLAAMEKHNIFAVVSGEPAMIARWRARSPRRFFPAIDFRLPETSGKTGIAPKSVEQLRDLHRRGLLTVIGEIVAQYEGVRPDDPRLEPLWAFAEEVDVPVAIHMGTGGPGDPYAGGGYRVALGDPLLLEPVLVRHPKLRISVMHAGYPMAEKMRALMFSYPQVYVDIGSIVYAEPRSVFYAFLRELVDAGYGDRIMFGSDQMIWPGVIGPSVRAIEEASFLTAEQKRDIFYNNAARFLRLTPHQIAIHHRP